MHRLTKIIHIDNIKRHSPPGVGQTRHQTESEEGEVTALKISAELART